MDTVDYSKPPKFEKRNHHFVPQFWQRHFRGEDRRLFKTSRGRIVVASTKSTMSADYIYLAFDNGWRATDIVEDTLSRWEATASNLISGILPAHKWISERDWASLCIWMGISTSRHPNVLSRYKPVVSGFALELATARDFSDYNAFRDHLEMKFGSAVSEEEYDLILTKSPDDLFAEVEDIDAMSQYDPNLPQTDALLSHYPVAQCMQVMDLTLIDAAPGDDFILGDNPLPNVDLGLGFTVPLSRHVALVAKTSKSPLNPIRMRQAATARDVDKVNEEQAQRSKQAIASSKIFLKKWIDKLIPESTNA